MAILYNIVACKQSWKGGRREISQAASVWRPPTQSVLLLCDYSQIVFFWCEWVAQKLIDVSKSIIMLFLFVEQEKYERIFVVIDCRYGTYLCILRISKRNPKKAKKNHWNFANGIKILHEQQQGFTTLIYPNRCKAYRISAGLSFYYQYYHRDIYTIAPISLPLSRTFYSFGPHLWHKLTCGLASEPVRSL